jgi:outer membrane protein TolC
LTLRQVVETALERYPAVQVSQEQASAAAAAIRLARTSYLPRADFLGQVNRATHNNIFGLLLPQSVIAPISGPVLRTNSLSNVWGSAAGVLVSWEPFDFGLRKANVDIAEAARNRAGTQIAVTRLQVATAAADAFLTMLAARQTVTAARAGFERARVTHEVVAALAKNELRPGADESRARAELALAETQVIQAEQAVETARATIAQYLGVPANTIALAPGPLLDLPPVAAPAAEAAPDRHPLAVAQNAAVAEVKAREKALDRSYFPRFNLQATAYARGSGVQPDNTTGNAASGLGPNIQNWGIGFTVLFPAFDLPAIHARKTAAAHEERAEEARYRQVIEDLNGERARAAAALAGARRVAQNTPVQLAAARDAESQAAARYKAGLANIVELAEAQRLLTQTEIDDALARLAVWRAELAAAAAAGDLTPYLLLSAK